MSRALPPRRWTRELRRVAVELRAEAIMDTGRSAEAAVDYVGRIAEPDVPPAPLPS